MGTSMGKSKKEKGSDDESDDGVEIELHPFCQPLADKKLSKKLFKCIKKATKSKQVLRGVKEVVKGVRKGAKGVCVIAGNISPLDVISHLPVMCEDAGVPYCYVPSKEDLGAAGQTKRPTSCMLLLPGPVKGKGEDADGKYKEAYDEVRKKVKAIAP